MEEINSIKKSKINNSEITQINISADKIVINENKIAISSSSNNIVVDEIIKNKIDFINREINEGREDDALKEIKSYMAKSDFHKLQISYQIEFLYLKAIAIFNKGDYIEVRAIAEQINKLEQKNVRYNQLLCELSIIENNDKEFIDSIKELEKKGIDEIETYKLKQLYNKRMYLEIVDKYIINNNFAEELMKRDTPVGIIIASCLELEEFEFAKETMEKVVKINKSYYIKYLYSIVNVGEILNRKVNYLGLRNKDKKVIKESLELLNSLKSYFDKNSTYRKPYYFYLLRCLFLLNPQNVINTYEELDDNLRDDINIKTIYGDSLILSDRYEESKNVWYSMKFDMDKTEILIRVIDALFDDKKYKEILEILVDREEYDEEGFLAARYSISYIKENEKKDKYKIIKDLENRFSKMPLFYVAIAQVLFSEYEEIDMSKQYMKKAIDISKNSEEMIKLIIAQVSNKVGMTQEAIDLLAKEELANKEAKLFLISLVKQKSDSTAEEQEKVEKIINEFINEEDELYLMYCYKADTLRRKKKNDEALIYFDKAFEVSSTELVSYYCIITKLEINDYNNIEKYVNVLEKSDKPQFLIIASLAYQRINNIEKSYETAYIAFEYLEGQYDEMVYANSIQLLLSPIDVKRQINFDEVNENMVVTLKESKRNRYICIDKGEERKLNNVSFNGCEHYASNSIIANLLLGKRKDEKVIIEEIEYVIGEITDKYIFCLRYAMNEYIARGADPKFIRAFTINEKDPFKEITEVMKENNEHTQMIINKYRKKEDNIGLPIKMLVQRLSGEYNEIMKALLYDLEGVFYAGELNKRNIAECVITLTSLVNIKILKIEDFMLQYKDKIYITKSTIDLINDKFNKARNDKTSARMGIAEDGKSYMQEITEDMKKENIEFWREILILAKQFIIEDYSQDYEDGRIFEIIERADYDSMGFANFKNIEIIVDDLFIRRLNMSIYNKNNTNNATHFIFNSNINFNEILDNLENILKTQYVYCINKDIIKLIIKNIKDKSEYNKFEGIIQSLFRTKDMFLYHIDLFIDSIHELDERSIHTESMIKAIRIIASKIKEYGKRYEVNDIYLKFKFLRVNLNSIITPKTEYLNSLYDSSN